MSDDHGWARNSSVDSLLTPARKVNDRSGSICRCSS